MSTEAEQLRQQAHEALQAIWFWDYATWTDIEHFVTGPIATLLHKNMSDTVEDAGRELCALTLDEPEFLDQDTARIHAVYLWKDLEGAASGEAGETEEPAQAAEQAQATLTEAESSSAEASQSEGMIWYFLKENGRWKAASLSR